MKDIRGGVVAPAGFRAAGVSAGLKTKADSLDVGLIVSDVPATVAGCFTRNRVFAAPVRWSRGVARRGRARAILVNSGNANACTGPTGITDAERMAARTAERLGVPEETVFVCSTGPIGIPLPMQKIEQGIDRLADVLSPSGGGDAAAAILTTDTVAKEAAVEVVIDGSPVRIGGMAKGSGMIDPDMATMLAFLTTDAAVDREALQECLASAVSESFNRITVDGDQSCNDTVLFLANGEAGNRALTTGSPDWGVFRDAVTHVALQLATAIVRDGEGASRFVTVTVKGAVSAEDAKRAARAVANSLLVKTSWAGGDPNWGRVIDAVGYSGAEVEEDRVDIAYDGVSAVKGGMTAPGATREELAAVLAKPEFRVEIDLQLGNGADTVYTCDCSVEYVRINSEYLT